MSLLRVERHAFGWLAAVRVDDTVPEPEAVEALHAEERALLAGHGGLARSSFVAGRLAAHAALAAAGGPAGPVLRRGRGGPLAPDGWQVSISHKRGLAVALAAPADGARLGVDLELWGRARPAIMRQILTPRERAALDGLDESAVWPRVLAAFSVKEAVYKALEPFVGRYVGFEEAEVDGLEDALLAPGVDAIVGEERRLEVGLALKHGEGPFRVEARWWPGRAPDGPGPGEGTAEPPGSWPVATVRLRPA